jgi:hypothetical protein
VKQNWLNYKVKNRLTVNPMKNNFIGLCFLEIPLSTFTCQRKNALKFILLVSFLLLMASGSSAQTFIWTDSFIQGAAPTSEQCQKWNNFLDDLGKTSFISVTVSGTYDETGITITDPVAATELARLLNTRTAGSIVSGGHTWKVGFCGPGTCVTQGFELTVDGAGCNCDDLYTIRPYSTNENWGGVNAGGSCKSKSQTMRVAFNSGVSITADGPTDFCKGGSVTLTASSEKCEAPYTYLWSNGETTESITVTQAGSYSVTVTGSDGCSGMSSATQVTVVDTNVDAGLDAEFCDSPVQLDATGTTNGETTLPAATKLCIIDANGGKGNCTFTTDLCTDGYLVVVNDQFSQTLTLSNPTELSFDLYYSPISDISVFKFKLNGQEIGSFTEDNSTATCTPAAFGQYPRTITFTKGEFKSYWNDGTSNTLAVEISADDKGVYLAGIAAEVISTTDYYSWSPITGLSDASVKNPLASPNETTTYTVTYTGPGGCTATDQVVVGSCSEPPVAVCKSLAFSAGDLCEVSANAIDFDGGSTSANGGPLTYEVSPVGPYPVGITEVTLTVTDTNGKSSTCTTSVTVTESILPTIETPQDILVSNDAGACLATVVLTAPATADNCAVKSVIHDQPDDLYELGETLVTWTVTDASGNQQSVTQKVTVTNAAPVVNSVTLSSSRISINTLVTLTTNYTDNNVRIATLDWGDQSALETIENPANEFSASHTYSTPGSYVVTITLTDHCGASVTYIDQKIVVTRRPSGTVRGNGSYNSPAGSYLADGSTSGKTHFKVEASYNTAGETPVGNTTFNLKAAKLEFKSTAYEWLMIDGQTAILKGLGNVNGSPGYEILVSVLDDDSKPTSKEVKKSDKVRIKIWQSSGAVLYDTQPGAVDEADAVTNLESGYIEIENGSSTTETISNTSASSVAYSFEEVSTTVYPNPFRESLTVRYYSSSKQALKLLLMDVTGREVLNQEYAVSPDGSYSVSLPQGEKGIGLYTLKITQGKRVEFLRLIRK